MRRHAPDGRWVYSLHSIKIDEENRKVNSSSHMATYSKVDVFYLSNQRNIIIFVREFFAAGQFAVGQFRVKKKLG